MYQRSAQRVWLVEDDGTVVNTHRVSGRLDNPRPGTYRVFSKSRWAGIGATHWEYMVRFAKGVNGDNIGFHAIPIKRGRPLQTEGQLGQPLSHGCVRQSMAEAINLWNWAPVGTVVVVLR